MKAHDYVWCFAYKIPFEGCNTAQWHWFVFLIWNDLFQFPDGYTVGTSRLWTPSKLFTAVLISLPVYSRLPCCHACRWELLLWPIPFWSLCGFAVGCRWCRDQPPLLYSVARDRSATSEPSLRWSDLQHRLSPPLLQRQEHRGAALQGGMLLCFWLIVFYNPWITLPCLQQYPCL